jgi:spore maturation protein CgeB
MLSGAISVTDTSEYIEDKFINGNNIVIYSLKDLNNLPNLINDLLSNPEKAKIIAQNGYEEALKKHTWNHRIKDVLQSIKEFEGRLITNS